MADALPAHTTTWHGKPLYVCPHCGTSRFTPEALTRHLAARHDVGPAMPAPQGDAAPAPTADAEEG